LSCTCADGFDEAVDHLFFGWHLPLPDEAAHAYDLTREWIGLKESAILLQKASMELMRHSTPEMTLATYAQTIGDEKREAGHKLQCLSWKVGKPPN
jgi:hypothetical protein